MRVCKNCGKEKELKEFNKNKGCMDGYGYMCKACVKECHVEWYLKNREEIIKRTAIYQETRPDKRLK